MCRRSYLGLCEPSSGGRNGILGKRAPNEQPPALAEVRVGLCGLKPCFRCGAFGFRFVLFTALGRGLGSVQIFYVRMSEVYVPSQDRALVHRLQHTAGHPRNRRKMKLSLLLPFLACTSSSMQGSHAVFPFSGTFLSQALLSCPTCLKAVQPEAQVVLHCRKIICMDAVSF